MKQLRYKASHIILLVAISILVGPDYCTAQAEEKYIPLPIGEITEVLIKWWSDNGSQIQRTEPRPGFVRLHSTKGPDSCQVDLSPQSPLATRINVRFSGVNAEIRRREFWDHLSRYLDNPTTEVIKSPDRPIPTVVLSKIESVVCINAISNDNNAQFSGFIINNNGLILCTAHDLGNSQDLTVTLYDGQEVKAKLLFRDPDKDLSILQIALKTNAAIRLSEGRNLLGMGEAIFTVGCPVNLRGTVYSGIINSPPRKMNNQPLWQAQMEIHHGSSGSPVFDINGKIVAVVKGRYRGTTTTAFLIPMETITLFFKEKNLI